MIKILLLDNHDSFTYNLAALIKRFDNVSLDILTAESTNINKISSYDRIIFSPGPGLPYEHKMMWHILDTYKHLKPILGVCLGHQAIGEYFGAKLENLDQVHHGWINKLRVIDGQCTLYRDIPDGSSIGVYHSWCVSKGGFPDTLSITGVCEENKIMSMKHDTFDIQSVQFHPESFITTHGGKMIGNWLESNLFSSLH